jgi:hypothetical protein
MNKFKSIFAFAIIAAWVLWELMLVATKACFGVPLNTQLNDIQDDQSR